MCAGRQLVHAQMQRPCWFRAPHAHVAARMHRAPAAATPPAQGAAFSGLGSPHTPPGYVWLLAHMVQLLTATGGQEPRRQAGLLRELLAMQCGNGLMHERAHVAGGSRCTREHFEWANALLVVVVEQLLGSDCEAPAQAARARETLEAGVMHE